MFDFLDNIGSWFGGSSESTPAQSYGNDIPVDSSGWLDRYTADQSTPFYTPISDYSIFTGGPTSTDTGYASSMDQMSYAPPQQQQPSQLEMLLSGVMPQQDIQMPVQMQAASEPSFLQKLGGYADQAEAGMKKYSTLGALGVGGLQMWAAMKEKEKLEQRRRQQLEAQQAALAQVQAKSERYNAPIDMSTPAYSAARTYNPGAFRDMRKAAPAGSSAFFSTPTGNMAAAMNQEVKRADGGLIEGEYEDVTNFAGGGLGALLGATGGQDDKIPAALSDGEYVFDAESVSALGDGNTAAGAKKLDDMRVKIRKHKRKGPLSSIPKKAKEPMKYLEGGKK